MELIDVLRHPEPPRTEYFVEVPSEYGKLRLDIPGDVGEALTQTGVTAESAQAAHDLIGKAQEKVRAGDGEGGLDGLVEVVKQYPYSLEGYEALYNYYWEQEKRDETIYYSRQMIALEPRYRLMALLGKALGRAARYDEALLLQRYLWEKRQTATPEEAHDAVCDYLITLGRTGNAKTVIEIAGRAREEMGNESRLVYQYIYGHILDKQYAQARELLNNALPSLRGDDRLYSRFMEMSNLVDEMLKG